MPALIQFVDSISASPTVRLDINDSAAWFCTNFSAPLPRLRRSESGNSMRDGGVVGSATYDNRTLEIELTLVNTSTEDAAATEMQKLWRELDRPTNYLRYQREGMTKPVFFRLFRSDASDFEELWTTPIARNITLEILAEPFALGLPESLGPYTVNNDPAAASNPCRFDVSGVIGDVPAPAVFRFQNSNAQAWRVLSVRQQGTPATDLAWTIQQAETGTAVASTANPGGGPDATMSGSGTNNFLRTSFSPVFNMQVRVSGIALAATPGTYRMLAIVRRSDLTSVFNLQASFIGSATPQTRFAVTSVPVPAATADRIVVDLGAVTLGGGLTALAGPGYAVSFSGTTGFEFGFRAERLSGTGTLDWDSFIFIPADEATLMVSIDELAVPTDIVLDGVTERAILVSSGDPFAGGIQKSTTLDLGCAGSFPQLTPGRTHRFHSLSSRASRGAKTVKGDSDTVTIRYWPRYLYIRPVST